MPRDGPDKLRITILPISWTTLKNINLESIKAFRDAKVVNDKVYIISHAPYDVFEQTISAHISQYIGYSPSLSFNAFGDVVMQLNELIETDNKVMTAYIFNWADIVPTFEMNSRQDAKAKETTELDLLEQMM